jgi:mRNA interferase MazF
MPTFRVGDIVKVPFPYTDRPVRERRPVLVVASNRIQEQHGLLWVLMITSVANRGWPGDVEIADLGAAGLSAESVVRTAKIATIEIKEALGIGVLPSDAYHAVERQVMENFGFVGPR